MEAALLAATGLGLSIVTVAAFISVYRLRAGRIVPPLRGTQPAISIFKPLKGSDDELATNLRSFFELDYPQFELLFAVRNPHDPAVAIVEELQAQFPHVASRLVIAPEQLGFNPKVNNLIHLHPHARHELFLISDSNVRVSPGYLTDLAHDLDTPGTGLVTSTIRGRGAESPGSVLENLHLNTYVAPAVFSTGLLFGRPIVIGKSMLFRRDDLDRLGGFTAFVNLLAEDQLIGNGIRKLGKRVRTSSAVIDNINVSWTLEQFFNRHVRWGIIRRSLSPALYSLEILSNPVALACAYAAFSGQPDAFTICGLVALYKIGLDWMVGRAMGSDLKHRHYLIIPLKDLFLATCWAIPFFKRHVNWRGNNLRVGRNTTLSAARGSAA